MEKGAKFFTFLSLASPSEIHGGEAEGAHYCGTDLSNDRTSWCRQNNCREP
jgi:hypothetical protein